MSQATQDSKDKYYTDATDLEACFAHADHTASLANGKHIFE